MYLNEVNKKSRKIEKQTNNYNSNKTQQKHRLRTVRHAAEVGEGAGGWAGGLLYAYSTSALGYVVVPKRIFIFGPRGGLQCITAHVQKNR